MAGRRTSGLDTYRRKRRFDATPEPAATPRVKGAKAPRAHPFVIHLHHARRRHFDLRLATGRVLRSWAVPKGPSLDPAAKRLAVEVEDHPLGYADFEGIIPEGHYGAGTVAIWDEGTWTTREPVASQMEAGHLRFELRGARLHGAWSLVRTRLKGRQPQWLLIKADDAFAVAGDVADDVPLSQWRGVVAAEPARPRSPRRPVRALRRLALPAATAFDFELARLHRSAPGGDDWLHEVKYDGYRMLAWRRGATVRLSSRNRLDWTRKLPAIAHAIGALACRECVLDGELVVTDTTGRSRFDLLQREFGHAESERVRYMVFDLLWLDGTDLRASPLVERKTALEALLESPAAALGFAGFLRGHGAEAWREACKAGLEGVMSKRVDSPYRGGRGDDWRKLKCIDSDEFVVVGYTAGKGSRGALGALLLARPEGRGWRYVGRVGTGMDEAMLEHLRTTLDPAGAPPRLAGAPDARQLRGARPLWVQPRQVVEIAYRGRTADGLLRQASFKGLRPDKAPADLRDSDRATGGASMPAKRNAPARAGKVRLTHPDRVLIEPTTTKQALADFYAAIAAHLLPGLVGRPLALLRCPDGAGAGCFFQKHPMAGMPDAVHAGDARKLHGKQAPFVYVDDITGVLGLVQMNAIEFHPWGSTIDDLEHPDRLVFDLDPDTGVAWARVKRAATLLRKRLSAVGLESFLRTTGGKGLHVVVPLSPRPDWEAAKAFAHALARTFAEESPREFVSVAAIGRRKDRIFIDYLRNARGATAVASYCVRARPGAPVATPLRWEELSRLRSASQYTIANVARRLKTMRQDPWHGIDKLRQSLPRT